jgi:hypothetical protein
LLFEYVRYYPTNAALEKNYAQLMVGWVAIFRPSIYAVSRLDGDAHPHRLTADAAQRASMEAAGWVSEGVVMCAP